MAKAKQAHDRLIADVHRAQANALAIRARAEMRLAEEYDAAQDRGEVTGPSDRHSNSRQEANKATAADLGLSHKDIHSFRKRRDRETADPGATQRALDAILDRGEEPTSAALDREMSDQTTNHEIASGTAVFFHSHEEEHHTSAKILATKRFDKQRLRDKCCKT